MFKGVQKEQREKGKRGGIGREWERNNEGKDMEGRLRMTKVKG